MGLSFNGINGSSKVVEINLTEQPTTKANLKTNNYIYFRAPQEKVLKIIHNAVIEKGIKPKKLRQPLWLQ